jgi:hypothetical protein
METGVRQGAEECESHDLKKMTGNSLRIFLNFAANEKMR